MPMIKIQTSSAIEDSSSVLKKLSSLAADVVGKPESYIMTSLEANVPMTFAGSCDPAAYIECLSIGLGDSDTKSLSAFLCTFCENELGVSRARVYIAFSGPKGSMWGWNGSTF